MHSALITDPSKQILLPVIFYIDGANTGQFVDLPLTAVRISLGIFTRKARDKRHLWRTLGYTPSHTKQASQGKRLMVNSGHMDSVIAHPIVTEEIGNQPNKEVPKAQDLHFMLDVIFKSHVKLQNTGFIWDSSHKTKVYKDVQFVMFTPFLKVDSDEADKLCGKCASRTSNVKQLCRHCECPTDHSDGPCASHPPKTKPKIMGMIERKEEQNLKNLSQHCLQNAMHKMRFGFHNDQGVHGACPMDMLHALLLGMFRHIRDCFFEQIGPTSKLSDEINAWAMKCGELISRQSDRDFPKTRFANGILKGKLNAKDFPGALLCLSTTLRCKTVRKLLVKSRPSTFNDDIAHDWQTLVDASLQWEQWLKGDEMEVRHVKLAEKKHRFLMHLMKKVGRRAKGMGLKTLKFHAIQHLTNDILNFGVPMESDTGSNETGHKPEKTAAKLTQKKKEDFDLQTAWRLLETLLLDLAEAKIDGTCLWNHCEDIKESPLPTPRRKQKRSLWHHPVHVEFDEELNKNIGTLKTKKGQKTKMSMEDDILNFVAGIQEIVSNCTPRIAVQSSLHRNGHIFRASSNFLKNVWRDWAMVDWAGDDGHLPCHFMGFIDLSDSPDDFVFS